MSSPASNGNPVALVTGSSSGIGAASVRKLLDRGFVTYASARNPEAVGPLVAAGARPLRLDVTDDASMTAAVNEVVGRHGRIDVVVNNAGIGIAGPIEEVSMANFRRQFEVNVFGIIRLTQLVAPTMRAAGTGRIVIVGSVGGLFTSAGAGPYHMSKYAVESLSDALRVELKPFGIAVSLLQPTGVRRTPFVDKQRATVDGADGPYSVFKKNWDASVEALVSNRSATVDVDKVADAVVKAATVRRPKSRYKVGAAARAFPLLRRLLGDRGWDAMMRQQIPAT